ncbi:MAG: hypothetical protein Q7S22_01420 [Candidatus Micrarchaeota archaeon]|nr:hypothetical protein [Candidatus Micrarchaeota archaeon]
MTYKPRVLQVVGKDGRGAFDSTTLASRRKHLIDCNVVVFMKDRSHTSDSWTDVVTVALGYARENLSRKCRSLHIHYTNAVPTSVPLDVDISRPDIAVFMFYGNVKTAVHRLIGDLRRQNPNIYVVIVSATPEDVEKGKADLVVDKTESLSDVIPVQLSKMLCNEPIGAGASTR